MFVGLGAITTAAALCLLASPAAATTYQVGAARAIKTMAALPALKPGDVVEVDGGETYAGGLVLGASGTAAAPITVRGKAVGGKRPVFSGGANTVEFRGSHYVFEGFEITAGTGRCLYHHADNITVRDTVIHDCPGHGLLGADNDSGTLTLEYVEVYRCGAGESRHQIYMATDEDAYPGAVFRMRHCYVHDGTGGNNVKTRAERNEIYYNWIEGAYWHELELIGPDPAGGIAEAKAREDSDVVGNVLRKAGGHPSHFIVRVGGDGTGQTLGRYRFANNTFLLAPGSSAVFRAFTGLESIEMHNNVIHRDGGGAVRITSLDGAVWTTGSPVIGGTNNWIPTGSTDVPPGWMGTLTGTSPMLGTIPDNLRPAMGSPLVNAGRPNPPTLVGHEFPMPLAAPMFLPPPRALQAPGGAVARGTTGTIDIGAYELESPEGGGPATGTGGAPGTGGNAGTGGSAPGTGGSGSGAGGAGPGTGGASPGTGGSASGTGGDTGTGGQAGSGAAASGGGCTVGGAAGHDAGLAAAGLWGLLMFVYSARARCRRERG